MVKFTGQGAAKKKVRGDARSGLGGAIANNKKKQIAAQPGKNSHVEGKQHQPQSILVQSNLEEFMDRAQKTQREFDCEKEYKAVFDAGTVVKQFVTEDNAPRPKADVYVPIPRRPQWTKSMTAEELEFKENIAFDKWRRELADIEERENTIVFLQNFKIYFMN